MEIAISSFRASFFARSSATDDGSVRVASARAGNVLGGGDWARNRIVPDAIRCLHSNEVLTVRSPNAIRPWQHVLEPLSGYLTLGSSLLKPGSDEFAAAWNFGPDISRTYTVADLVQTTICAWGSGSWLSKPVENEPHEADMLRLSIDKASYGLGWRPAWTFEETVNRTVHWYSRYFEAPEDQVAIFNLCVRDITAYELEACEKGIAWARQTIGAAVES
jgi:CDP-glucose 4,6-dehydratase